VSLCPLLLGARAAAASGGVDGISDQSLPAWIGPVPGGPLSALFRAPLGAAAGSPITLARYVVQWNALTEPSAGADANGDYRERFEAWLADVRDLGLTPVLALTSYDGVHPRSVGEYTASLQDLIAAALALGRPIAYVEPWNEPNNQGREDAGTAAALANAAAALCAGPAACRVIAGDFEDQAGLPAYERAYERALTFAPEAWGVHPYVSVKNRQPATLLSFKAALPGRGSNAEIWYTEIGAFYCRHGRELGQESQAAEASYLVNTLMRDPAVAPVHVLYYELMSTPRSAAPCAGGGEDSGLYGPGGEPRAAAGVVFPTAGLGALPAFGPDPVATAIALPGAGVG
jgi:hypothetical protein